MNRGLDCFSCVTKALTSHLQGQTTEMSKKQPKQQCNLRVREVLNSNRLAPWETLFGGANLPDIEIVEVVKRGADLTGEPTVSPPLSF